MSSPLTGISEQPQQHFICTWQDAYSEVKIDNGEKRVHDWVRCGTPHPSSPACEERVGSWWSSSGTTGRSNASRTQSRRADISG